MLAHPAVAAVSDRRRRSEIDATIYVAPYSSPPGNFADFDVPLRVVSRTGGNGAIPVTQCWLEASPTSETTSAGPWQKDHRRYE